MLLLLPVLLSFVALIDGAKILAIIPTPSYSHQITFRPIWKELAKRGHQITLITTDPMNENLANITEIDVHDSYQIMNEFYSKVHILSTLKVTKLIIKLFDDLLDHQLSKKSIKALMVNESLFDIVITESIFFEYLALADLYNCPKVLISSLEVSNFIYEYLGATINPAINPDMTLRYFGGQMDFKERLFSFIYQHFYSIHKWAYGFNHRHQLIKKHFGEHVRYTVDILKDTDLVLSNTNPLLHDIRPIGPNIIPFGGGIHLLPLNPLPEDLKEYLDSAKNGFIYFSLGTNSKSVHMEPEKIRIILEALGELPFKILWKFEFENIQVPKNVKLISWAPQQDVLRHPNIKLFISQGGIQSIEEGIIYRVPLVMLPMYGDQTANARRIQHKGATKIIPHQPLPDKEEFKSIVMEVIENPKYKENLIKISELLQDQPMKSVDKAVWWIEYVIRHKGAKHLKSPIVDFPFYKYYNLDLLGTIILFFVIVLLSFIKILSILIRSLKYLICGRWRKSKTSKQKKRQ